jgi:hypothetical protein
MSDELAALLGYLWTATGIDGRTRPCDLFREDDPLSLDVAAALSRPPAPALDVEETRAAVSRVIDGSLREAGYPELPAAPDDDLLVRLTVRLARVFAAPLSAEEPS